MSHLQATPLCEAAGESFHPLLFLFLLPRAPEEAAASVPFALQSHFSQAGGCLALYVIMYPS